MCMTPTAFKDTRIPAREAWREGGETGRPFDGDEGNLIVKYTIMVMAAFSTWALALVTGGAAGKGGTVGRVRGRGGGATNSSNAARVLSRARCIMEAWLSFKGDRSRVAPSCSVFPHTSSTSSPLTYSSP